MYNDNKPYYNMPNILDDTTELRCWNNEKIANIFEQGEYYEFNCYETKSAPASDWICEAGAVSSRPGAANSIYAYRKNVNRVVECGAVNNSCKSYKDVPTCTGDKQNIFSGVYKCDIADSTNKNHWCAFKYESLTKAGY